MARYMGWPRVCAAGAPAASLPVNLGLGPEGGPSPLNLPLSAGCCPSAYLKARTSESRVARPSVAEACISARALSSSPLVQDIVASCSSSFWLFSWGGDKGVEG